MTDCDSVYNGYRCQKEKDHSGIHSFYSEPTVVEDGYDDRFIALQWNDEGQTLHDLELGRAFNCNYDLGAIERRKIMNLVIYDAKQTLKKGDVFEVRAKLYPQEGGRFLDYGRTHFTREHLAKNWGIAWYHMPQQPKDFEAHGMKQEPLFIHDIDEGYEPNGGGYILIARIKV